MERIFGTVEQFGYCSHRDAGCRRAHKTAGSAVGHGRSGACGVPLFGHGSSAFASGIGERLKPVSLGERHYVLVLLPLHVSTAEVFQHPQLKRDCAVLDFEDILAAAGKNVCEQVVMSMYPIMASALADLAAYGDARMTGTGSCIFLVMPDAEAAMRATLQLNSLYNVRAVRGLDKSPVHELLQKSDPD